MNTTTEAAIADQKLAEYARGLEDLLSRIACWTLDSEFNQSEIDEITFSRKCLVASMAGLPIDAVAINANRISGIDQAESVFARRYGECPDINRDATSKEDIKSWYGALVAFLLSPADTIPCTKRI